jgi:glycosyltransferase involved in cell wall biosynthesis
MTKASDIKVSVIVPTCGRAELLKKCLAALACQVFERSSYEVIVVDDAASRETRRVVEEYEQKGLMVRYIPVIGKHGPASARNTGLRLSRGEIIAFTDDDCIPDPRWLKTGTMAFMDGIVGASGKLVVPLAEKPSDYEMNAARLEHSQFVTANSFYRRPALVGIGGFDERFRTAWREDSDLFFRLLKAEKKLTHVPEAVVVHPVRPAPWGISVKQQRKNVFNALLYKKHRDLYRQKLKPVFPWHYYLIVLALILSIVSALAHKPVPGFGLFFAWVLGTVLFCAHRLRGSSHSVGHVLEMIVTSIAIPPVCIFWRLVGAVKYRVLFA